MADVADLLKGQTAVVTGSSSGIGRAIALELAKAGAQIAVTARTGGELEEVVAKIRSAGGVAALTADERQTTFDEMIELALDTILRES